jgi:DUF971 family protein
MNLPSQTIQTAPSRQPWPLEIHVFRAARRLDVTFDDGVRVQIPAELLRVESPSAEVQGHSPNQKQLITGKRTVAITAVEPVGNYAVRIRFDDGHDTGLYTWPKLRSLGTDADTLMAAYISAVEQVGLEQTHSKRTRFE